MSTRCWIGQKREDGIHAFYCHHDGYPEWVGRILITNYNTKELATKLVDLCYKTGTSFIEPSLEETEGGLYNRYKEDGSSLPIFKTEKEFLNCDFDIEYVYLFDNEEWKVSHSWKDGGKKFIKLKRLRHGK